MPKKPKKEKGDRLWFKVLLWLLPLLASSYLKLVDLTSRKIYLNGEYENETCRIGPFIAAVYHGKFLFTAYYLRKYRPVTMVSRSWDGEFGANMMRRWGIHTTRGSSSLGGKEALQEMIETVREKNLPGGLTVDGPRGPAGQVKMGVVVLGRETGYPVLPVTVWTTRHLQFRSWDSFIVPLPFSTIVVAFGEPTRVPQGLSNEAYEDIRSEIEQNMAAAQGAAEGKVGEILHRQAAVDGAARTETPNRQA